MKIMLDQSLKKIEEKTEKFDFPFWQFRTPLTNYRIGNLPYALDNGCFSGDLPKCWYSQLEEARNNAPIFVVLPDVVCSARRTLELFERFTGITKNLPRALVLQNGIGDFDIPWESLSAVFVGGDDPFKVSDEAFHAARCAKILGKWIHVGRVNEIQRAKNWIGLADSIDGSGISRFDHQLQAMVDFLQSRKRQMELL